MKTPAYYLKTVILMLLLTVESYFLTNILLAYVRSENYFAPPMQVLVIITVMLLMILYTYTLTVGAWDKWEQYIIVPLPISAGMLLGLSSADITYAILVAVVSYLILSYDILASTNLSKKMVYFDPRTILNFSNRGMLFVFSLLAATMAFIHPAVKNNQFDFAGKIADITQSQVDTILESQTATSPVQSQFGGTGFSFDLSNFNLDLRDMVRQQVDAILAPYKQFIPPLIALLVFTLIRFLGSIAGLVFSLTSPLLFKLARGTGLLHVLQVPVMKETLSFSNASALNETGPKTLR